MALKHSSAVPLTWDEHPLPRTVGRVQGEGAVSADRRLRASARSGAGSVARWRPLLRPRCPGDRVPRMRARAVADSGALWDGNQSGASGQERAAAAAEPGRLGGGAEARRAGGVAGGAAMNLAVVKRTQEALGRVIRRPPLTEKLLSKPPFRYLHDIITEVGARPESRPWRGSGRGRRPGGIGGLGVGRSLGQGAGRGPGSGSAKCGQGSRWA